MASRPNPQVRADWERTRREFEAHEADLAAARAARIRNAGTARAVREASLAFPATPVATRRARAFRKDYLARVETKGRFIEPRTFAEVRGGNSAFMISFPILIVWSIYILVLTIQAPYSTLATVIWLVVQAVVSFFAWAWVVGLPLQYIGSQVGLSRYDTYVADAEAYVRWSVSVLSDPYPDPDPTS